MQLFVVGLNFRSAPLSVREKFSVAPDAIPSLIARLKSELALAEAVVLSTCNRFEIYGVASAARRLADPLARILDVLLIERCELSAQRWYVHEGVECIRHLLRVASSLDSLVVGETEIVGQVKRAYQISQAAAGTGKGLNRLFQNALSVSKQVRNLSGIGRCQTSVGSIALELAKKIFGDDLAHQTILVIGAGKMSETTLRHLVGKGTAGILVANRTFERAVELAGQFSAEAVPFDDLGAALLKADIVISSTSAPGYVVSKNGLSSIMAQRRHRPLLLIDLAVPRDIDPRVSELPGVYAANIDELAQLARENLEKRQAEAVLCEQLVLEQAQKLGERIFEQPSEPRRIPVDHDTISAFGVPFSRVVLAGFDIALPGVN